MPDNCQEKLEHIHKLLDAQIEVTEELSYFYYNPSGGLNPYSERCDELKKFREKIWG